MFNNVEKNVNNIKADVTVVKLIFTNINAKS